MYEPILICWLELLGVIPDQTDRHTDIQMSCRCSSRGLRVISTYTRRSGVREVLKRLRPGEEQAGVEDRRTNEPLRALEFLASKNKKQ